MKIKELLNNSNLVLPILVDNDTNVYNELEKRFKVYINLVKQVDEYKDIISIIESIQSKLKSAINLYFDGRPFNSYMEIESIFKKNMKDNLLIGSLEDISYPNEYKKLYRGRIGNFYEYKNYDLFHVPFDKRELINTERYSIPGFPCLYLGGSVYVCWEELGRPDFDKLYVSRYEANPKLKILDLSYTAQDFILADSGKSMEDKEFVKKFLITWSIICACSIKVKDISKRKFKTEYVIPQIILQVARSYGIDGIAYFSVNANYRAQLCKPVFINYVFPSDYVNLSTCNEKFSKKLKDNFLLTYPINYGLWEKLTDLGRDTLENYLVPKNKNNINDNVYRLNTTVSIYREDGPTYKETEIYKFEQCLDKIKAESLE